MRCARKTAQQIGSFGIHGKCCAAVYDEAIVPQYVEGVHELYLDDVESILSGSALAIDGDSISFEK